MGTDIHGIFQKFDRQTRSWIDISSSYEQGRHYQLFAVLAGVRNGYGFAGTPTGEAVKPIAKLRGFPVDFENENEYHPIADTGEAFWMGDHSHSWLSGAEMLAWAEKAPAVTHVGVLDRNVYEGWDGKSTPESYCGGISGPDVVQVLDDKVSRETTPNWTHIQCSWEVSLKNELAYFFDEVARLASEHGKIRFVFGFDS